MSSSRSRILFCVRVRCRKLRVVLVLSFELYYRVLSVSGRSRCKTSPSGPVAPGRLKCVPHHPLEDSTRGRNSGAADIGRVVPPAIESPRYRHERASISRSSPRPRAGQRLSGREYTRLRGTRRCRLSLPAGRIIICRGDVPLNTFSFSINLRLILAVIKPI